MKLLIILFCCFLTAGCAHPLTLYPKQGGEQQGTGTANSGDKKVTIQLNGKTYEGSYVYGGTAVGVAFGSSGTTSTMIGVGGSNGRILARSIDGDSIRCDFNYSGSSGLGVCEDSQGRQYDLTIK